MSRDQTPNVRFVTPPNVLRQKVGTGGIDPRLLDKGQEFLENNKIDFEPYARDFLEEIDKVVGDFKKDKIRDAEAIEYMIRPVMQLKANGGMFHYQLVSDIADVALFFLEKLVKLDNDALDILVAHQKTLQIIMKSNLKGSGGREGRALARELEKACTRYFSKHKINV